MKKIKKKWKTPKIVELPITMEISAYRCATLEEN